MTLEGDTRDDPYRISFIIYEFGVNRFTNVELEHSIGGTVWTFYYTELDVKFVSPKKNPRWNAYALTGFGVHMMTLDMTSGHDYYGSAALGLGTYVKYHKENRIDFYVRPKYVFGMQFGQHFGLDMGLTLGLCVGCK